MSKKKAKRSKKKTESADAIFDFKMDVTGPDSVTVATTKTTGDESEGIPIRFSALQAEAFGYKLISHARMAQAAIQQLNSLVKPPKAEG